MQQIKDILSRTAAELFGLEPDFVVSTPDELSFGDYSTNIALVLSRLVGRAPQDVAQEIIENIQPKLQDWFDDITEINGFVNFKLSKDQLVDNLKTINKVKTGYGSTTENLGKTVIVEYFQNNVAKPPHIGHIRSAVVGDALARVFEFTGHKTISDTHIGDWGTQFGILLYAFKTYGDKSVIDQDPINELNKLYVEMSGRIKDGPELKELAKQEFKKLEEGDRENRELWIWFVSESLKDFEKYKKLLKLRDFEYDLGESFYENHMPQVLEDFNQKGLIVTGETGEQYVDLEEFKLGRCILVKSDGATTYHLRDFATYIYRKQEFKFYKNIYVVDNRQSHHFRQLFKVLELAGYPVDQDSVHVDLGFMSLPEGAISTRKGNVISLESLLAEANKRALSIIEEKNPDLENKVEIANQVGLAAIKYFDLSHNRKTEIVFEWDKALSFEGNTGPYLQYTYARIQGILRKSKSEGVLDFQNVEFNDSEKQILRKLYQFPGVLIGVTNELLPSQLCTYLFDLAQAFNSFYQSVPVLNENDPTLKEFRLELVRATAQVIKNGLELLGIHAPEKM